MGIDATVGDRLEPVAVTSSLTTSVMYAGASGDHNPLHYDPTVAAGISPTGDCIAHGMFSMGLASRALTDWAGQPGAIEALDVRFTRPWPLGAEATFGGEVTKVEDGVATVRLTGTLTDGTVVLRGTGVVRM